MRYDEQSSKLIFSEEANEEDEGLQEDERTIKVIRNIANTVHPMIIMEEDFPSNYEDQKLPIVDLKCWVGQDSQIWFEHYEKPVSSRKIVMSRSAVSTRTKRNVHINECVRRLLNCKQELPWDRKAEYLSDYMKRMKIAGYGEKFRLSVLRQALARYDGMVEADQKGLHPLYRSKDWDKYGRRMEKTRRKSKWLKGYYTRWYTCKDVEAGCGEK